MTTKITNYNLTISVDVPIIYADHALARNVDIGDELSRTKNHVRLMMTVAQHRTALVYARRCTFITPGPNSEPDFIVLVGKLRISAQNAVRVLENVVAS